MDTKDMPTEGTEDRQPSATDRLKAQTSTVRDDLRELGRVSKDAAQEKLDEARRAAGGVYDQSRRKVGDVEDQLVDYIREKPLKSLIIAAGVGLVLGAFWSKR
jgi:ElaB/YqjD/DUF883 family membrane-anchored ribosome-binding protein